MRNVFGLQPAKKVLGCLICVIPIGLIPPNLFILLVWINYAYLASLSLSDVCYRNS